LCIALALPVVTWAAAPFHRATWRNLQNRTGSMDTLVSLGITASFGWAVVTLVFGISGPSDTFWLGFGSIPDGASALYLDVAAGMTTFQLAGRYFEARSRRRAGDVLGALHALTPATVRVVRDGKGSGAPVSGLREGVVSGRRRRDPAVPTRRAILRSPVPAPRRRRARGAARPHARDRPGDPRRKGIGRTDLRAARGRRVRGAARGDDPHRRRR